MGGDNLCGSQTIESVCMETWLDPRIYELLLGFQKLNWFCFIQKNVTFIFPKSTEAKLSILQKNPFCHNTNIYYPRRFLPFPKVISSNQFIVVFSFFISLRTKFSLY